MSGVAPLIASLRERFAAFTIVRLLKEDRLLRWAYGVGLVLVCVPMAYTQMLPLVDLGSHIGWAGVMDDLLRGAPEVSQRYEINPTPVPYWPAYLIINVSEVLFGAFIAGKVVVGVALALIPLSVMRLLLALGRDPRLGLAAFLLVWDTNLYWGWVTFHLTMPMVVWCFAWMIEARTFRDTVKVFGLSAVVGLGHPHSIMWLAVGGALLWLVLERPLHALARTAFGLAGLSVLFPWLFLRILFPPGGRGGAPLTFTSPDFEQRLAMFYDYSIGVFVARPAVVASVLVLLLLLIGPLLLSTLPRRDVTPRSTLQAGVVLLAATLLYLLLPYEIHGNVYHLWTYPRFSTWMLVGLLLLPAPVLRGRAAWFLAPVLAGVVALMAFRVEQFRVYGEYTQPYVDLMPAIRKGSRVAEIDTDLHFQGFRQVTLGQLHGYLTAERSLYDPHLFDHTSSPVLYRAEGKPPNPEFHRPDLFDLEKVGRHYDYVLLHPSSNGSFDQYLGKGLELVEVSGAWKLYSVTNPYPR